MNNCCFVGRLCSDPELRYTQSGIANCSFRIAVQRRFKNAQGEYEADFIQCVAWRQTAEFLNRYACRGDMVAVSGSLQTRSYDAQDGSKRYVTEIIVDSAQPCGGRRQANNDEGVLQEPTQEQGAMEEVQEDDLPF